MHLGSHVLAEPELALGRRVALVRLRHVLVHLFQGRAFEDSATTGYEPSWGSEPFCYE